MPRSRKPPISKIDPEPSHRLTLALPPDVARALRHLAAERTRPGSRVTVSMVIASAVRTYANNDR